MTVVDWLATMKGGILEGEETIMAQESTRVIGIRLPEDVAAAVKEEAATRKVQLKDLFKEMWELYWQAKREEQGKKNK